MVWLAELLSECALWQALLVSGVPLAPGGWRDVSLCVPLIPDIHVATQALTPLAAIPVIDLDLGRAAHSQEGIACTELLHYCRVRQKPDTLPEICIWFADNPSVFDRAVQVNAQISAGSQCLVMA